ncbi:MAG: hemolysin family protein [Limisphaerales bacterium]
MEVSLAIGVPLMLALAGLSILCSLAEAALFSLSRWQLRQMREGEPGDRRAAALLDEPDDLLSALSLGNTVANGMLLLLGLLMALTAGWPLATTLPLAFLGLLVFGEILPKTLAVRSPRVWAVRVTPAAALLQRLTRAIRGLAKRAIDALMARVLPAAPAPAPVSDEEYRELLDMAVQQGTLGHSEREIIAQLITLDRKRARDVMRPRATMGAVSDDLTTDELVAAARRHRHRRLPIYDETPDTIVGVLDTQEFLLDPDHRLEDAIEFPSFVPESMNLMHLFQALQRQKRSLAIVLDEFGGVAGVVRMEEILAEVLGEMQAPGAVRGLVFEKLGPGRWRASGGMRLDDFRREYPALPPVPDVETLGGLLLAELDIVPESGQSAVTHGLKLTATVVDERRIHELLVELGGGR